MRNASLNPRPVCALAIALTALCVSRAHAIADAVASPPVIFAGGAFDVTVLSAADAAGNVYVTGVFDQEADFNPGVGLDAHTPGSVFVFDVFVTRFNADGSYAWTQTFGGNLTDKPRAIAVTGSRVYVAGEFRGNAAGFGGSGTIGVISTKMFPNDPDAFVFALDAASGAPVSGFGRGGVETFGSTLTAQGSVLSVSAGILYFGGVFGGNNGGLGGVPGAISSQGDDIFLVALDANTAAPVPTFDFDGIYTSNTTGNENPKGIALSGGTLYLAGAFDFQFGGQTNQGPYNAFVLALDAATGAPRAGFGIGGVQSFGGTGNAAFGDEATSIAVLGNTVYAAGFFTSTNAGFGGTGTISVLDPAADPNYPEDVFVLALDAASGAPKTAFSADGAQIFGGSLSDVRPNIVAVGSTIYVTGYFESGNAGIGALGTVASTGTTNFGDAFILALDASTGLGVASFSGDGIQIFGGADQDQGTGIAVSGETLFVSGFFFSGNAGLGGPGAINATGFGGFLLRLGSDGNFAVPSINSPLTAEGTVGSAFNYQITATNNPTSFFANGLPDGLNVTPSTGIISGVPTQSGQFPVTISATNAAGAKAETLDLTINPPPPVITSPTTDTATAGASYTYTIAATNSPTDFSVLGLPAGLSVVATSGVISGTPTVEGTFNLTLSAGNGGGTGSAALVLTIRPAVPVITSALAVTATQGQPFSYAIAATSNPTSFGAAGLPAGLSVDAAGVISGIPTDLGSFNVALSAANASGTGSATLALTLVASNVPTLASLSRTSALPGEAGFTLVLTGANFVANSGVFVNGTARTTTFDSITQLSAAIPASDLATAQRLSITVVNPAPGGGTSNALTFGIYNSGIIGTWLVTNTFDSGSGSLRFALANCGTNDAVAFDAAVFALTNSDAATIINVNSELPALDDGGVTVDAQDRRVTVNGAAAAGACGLVITSSNNSVRGLNIIGFGSSGICVRGGANNNILGGSRLTGSGPNGQGLRISRNGAFGIEISGAGTDGNSVRGCWIGLDAAGSAAEPNLAGVLIFGGARANVIGGTPAGEANVISGNSFEGVTVSGAGTDDNVITANVVGAAAVDAVAREQVVVGTLSPGNSPRLNVGTESPDHWTTTGRDAGATSRQLLRRPLANGSAGVFLSLGTRGSRVGADAADTGEVAATKANTIAFNGGTGIEVRALDSRANSSRANSISANVRGGIALFDNSNGGIGKPLIRQIVRRGTVSRALLRQIRVTGTSPRDGAIEIFNDTGAQGATLLGRAIATGGVWEADLEGSDTENVTATITDAEGNTSQFDMFAGPVITSAAAATAGLGFPFSYAITASGSPTAFSAAGLPAGLSIDPATGVISGAATTLGTFTVTLSASNGPATDPITGSAILTLTVQQDSDAFAASDLDGDGVSDVLEQLAGTDPANPADAPEQGGLLVVDKIGIALSFTSPTRDSIKASLRLILPEGFATTGAQVSVRVADHIEIFMLDEKGGSPKGDATLKLKGGSPDPGLSTVGAFALSVKNKDLKAGLASAGLTDKTTAKEGDAAILPIAVVIGTGAEASVYAGTVPLTYKATKGKAGKAGKRKR